MAGMMYHVRIIEKTPAQRQAIIIKGWTSLLSLALMFPLLFLLSPWLNVLKSASIFKLIFIVLWAVGVYLLIIPITLLYQFTQKKGIRPLFVSLMIGIILIASITTFLVSLHRFSGI